MASMEVILARSAMSLASKVNILVQEGGRRVRNCSPTLEWDSVLPHLNKLMVSMFWAGYPDEVRRLVATRIMARRATNLQNLQDHQRPLYRDKATRRAVPTKDKATWFRDSGATATIMVPTTPGSALAKGLREVLRMEQGPKRTSVKVVERPGAAIHQGLARNNPFPRQHCHREDCPYAKAGSLCKEKCLSVGLVYKATCMKCEAAQEEDQILPEDRVHSVYIGESSRTLYVRYKEHMKDYIKAARDGIIRTEEEMEDEDTKSSWMWDHSTLCHGARGLQDVKPDLDYKFEVFRGHRDPLSRQVDEALRIIQAREYGTLSLGSGQDLKLRSLNRKDEHFAPRRRRQQ